MFIFGLLVVSGSSAVNLALDRLQNQMVNMLNGTEFDGFPGNAARNEIDFNTFKYGCHCRFDRSMQQMGRGEPVDAIDSACKVYKVSSEFKGQLKVKLKLLFSHAWSACVISSEMNAILKARHIQCSKYRVATGFQKDNNVWTKLELAKEIFANAIWLLLLVGDLWTAFGRPKSEFCRVHNSLIF